MKNMTFSVEDCLSTFILHFIGHLEMTEASEATYDMIAPGPGDGDMLAIVLQKVPSEANPKVRNHGEGPY